MRLLGHQIHNTITNANVVMHLHWRHDHHHKHKQHIINPLSALLSTVSISPTPSSPKTPLSSQPSTLTLSKSATPRLQPLFQPPPSTNHYFMSASLLLAQKPSYHHLSDFKLVSASSTRYLSLSVLDTLTWVGWLCIGLPCESSRVLNPDRTNTQGL